MRSPLGKALRKSFSSKVQHSLQHFVSVKENSLLPGDLLYVWRFRPNLNFYILLSISQKFHDDSFTVELACSADDFPFTHAALGPNPQKDGSVRFRLPQLYRDEWRPRSGWEPRWWIGPPRQPALENAVALDRALRHQRPLLDPGLPIQEALILIEPQVEDAIDRIRRFGIPYFEHFAHSQLKPRS